MKKRTAILILTLITIFCFVPMSASAAESNVIHVSNQKNSRKRLLGSTRIPTANIPSS